MTGGATQLAILALTALFLVLLASMATFRSAWSLTKGKAADTFDPAGKDMGEFGYRLTRVHANAYEFLPMALIPLVYAVATDRTSITDTLALWFVALRVGQVVTHLLSASKLAVLLRFLAFFIPQLAILFMWVWCLYSATMAS